jgi:predicted acetyltransferase
MAELEIHVDRAGDAARFLASDQLVWFNSHTDEPLERLLVGIPESGRFAATLPDVDTDPATYPGIYATRPMELAVPDGSGAARLVPVSGLTWVGVHPDHRRRGLLTAMLRHHFRQCRDEGVHLSALHASEPAIYGRHGYGLAALEHKVDLGHGTRFTAPGLEDEVAKVSTRLGSVDDPGMAERRRACDLALGRRLVGVIVGDARFYDELSLVPLEDVRDQEKSRVIFATRDGVDLGYTTFRRKHKWENGRPGAEIEASVSAGPVALLALLRRLVELDLGGTVTVYGMSAATPLTSWVDGPRATSDLATYDCTWLRLVDLPAAIASRGYGGDTCDVVVEVADTAAPWNAGRWRLRVSGGEGSAEPTDDDAEIALDGRELGAAYLGGANLVTLLEGGVIAEHRPGAVRELWHAVRTDTPPHPSRGF